MVVVVVEATLDENRVQRGEPSDMYNICIVQVASSIRSGSSAGSSNREL